MYGCESWIIKKSERWRIDAFELWCWRRLLRVPWTAKQSNQSILKEISPEYSLERLMLKLKLQYFDHLMRGTDSLEKILMLGKIEGGRRRGQQRMRWLDGITDSWTWVWVNSRSWWWTGKPGVFQFMEWQRVRHDWETELNRFFTFAALERFGEDLVNGHTLSGRRGSSLWSRGESSACLPALPGVGKTFILLASGANLLEWVRPTHSTS